MEKTYLALENVGTHQPRAPATVVGVQMSAQDVVKLLRVHARECQAVGEIHAQVVEARETRCRFVIADAAVHQNSRDAESGPPTHGCWR